MPFNYGSRKYTEGVYGGHDAPLIDSWPAVIIDVFENTGARRGTFQAGVGDFISCNFSVTEKGSAEFTLKFANFVDLEKENIIKIKLFNSLDYFFAGVVRVIPIQGSTQTDYIYSGFGLVDYLYRINAESLSYANKTIEYILDDLLDNVITAKTPITKNAAKIIPPAVTLVSFDINYSQISDVIDSLVDVANSEGFYIAGVDGDGDFFFLPRSDETKVTLVTGAEGRYGIDQYNPQDTIEAKTKYFVLDKDGSFIQSITSAEDNDIFEEKITAPDLDNAAAVNWAEGILAENERITRSAAVQWRINEWDPLRLVGDGNIRIISNIVPEGAETPTPLAFGAGTFGSGLFGGGQYEGYSLNDILRIVQVNYILSGNETVRNIQLGNRPVQLDAEIVKLRKDLTDLRISLGR